MTDVVARAKAALEGVYQGPWINVGGGNIHVDPVGSRPPTAKTWTKANGDFIAAARSLVPELVAEVERLEGALQQVREMATVYTPSPDLVEAIAEVVAAAVADQGTEKP